MNKNLIDEVATASLSGNEPVKAVEQVKVVTPKNEEKPKSARRRKTPPVYSVLTSARQQFGKQIRSAQNLETKRICIDENISKCYGDAMTFWSDLMKEAADLTDSVKFNTACSDKGLDPKNVAQHIIFLGKTVKKEVMEKGVQCLGDMIYMFRQPLFEDKLNIFKNDSAASNSNPADKPQEAEQA